jgi:uncharacterized membrane protein
MVVWNTALHIVCVVFAFGLTAGVGIFLGAIAQSGDVRTIRTAARAARPLFLVGSILLVLGILFGFGTASMAGYSLGSHWLLSTYVLVALLLIITGAIHAPWSARLARAAAASPDDQPSAELRALLGDRFAAAAGPATGALWIAIILMMVAKPS